jgi:hypothetical protein
MSQDPSSRVASWLTPAGDNRAPDDRRILALFREWVVATRVWSAVNYEVCDKMDPTADDKAKAQAALQVVNATEGEIVAASPTGATGLAIKTYLLIHYLDDWARDDQAALSARGMAEGGIAAAIAKDLARFVPELAPLVEGEMEEQAAEPSESPEASWCRIRETLGSIAGKRELTAAENRLLETLDRLGWGLNDVPEILGFGEPEEEE